MPKPLLLNDKLQLPTIRRITAILLGMQAELQASTLIKIVFDLVISQVLASGFIHLQTVFTGSKKSQTVSTFKHVSIQ